MGLSEFYEDADETNSIAVIHHALEMGVNFFDASDFYDHDYNEELFKKAFVDAGKRAEAIIATKFDI